MNIEKVLTTQERAKVWLEELNEKFAALSEDEQAKWLKETPDGQSYTDIMNSSWREDWEDVIEQEYLRRFGE